jgi:hypothetical protein
MEKDNPYIDPALDQAHKLKQIIDKLAVWEARKQKTIESPDYAANKLMSVWNEGEELPEQIEIQKQIDELIYSLTSFKIGHEDDEDWVPEEGTDKITMVKLKKEMAPKPLEPNIIKPSFRIAGTFSENESEKKTVMEIISMAKKFHNS